METAARGTPPARMETAARMAGARKPAVTLVAITPARMAGAARNPAAALVPTSVADMRAADGAPRVNLSRPNSTPRGTPPAFMETAARGTPPARMETAARIAGARNPAVTLVAITPARIAGAARKPAAALVPTSVADIRAADGAPSVNLSRPNFTPRGTPPAFMETAARGTPPARMETAARIVGARSPAVTLVA